MNYTGSIWETISAFLQVNNFDKHFDNEEQPDFTKLLNDENIITEFKNQNQKLMKYMSISKYEQLVKFIIEMPPDAEDSQRAFKFPYISCEILTADISQIFDAFLEYTEPIPEIKQDSIGDQDMKSDDGQPQGRMSIQGKPSQKQEIQPIDSQDAGDFANRFGKVEEKVGIMWNFQAFHDKYEDVQQQLKDEKAYNTKQYLQIQELQEQKEAQANIIKKLQEQLKASQQKNKSLLELQQDNGSSSQFEKILFMEKNGTYLLSLLISFLDTEEPVNLTQAGYFSKILTSLTNKRETELINFIYERPHVVESLKNQLHSRALAEFTHKILTFECNDTKEAFIDLRKQLITHIITLIIDESEEDLSHETRSNCTYIIGETMKRCESTFKGEELFQVIIEEGFPQILGGVASKNSQVVYSCSILVNILLQVTNQTYSNYIENKQEDDDKQAPFSMEQIEDAIAAAIPKIVDTLIIPVERTQDTQFRQAIQPLGQHRIKIIELINCFLQQQKESINQALADKKFFSYLMTMFIKYEWNNILHNRVEKIVSYVLTNKSKVLLQALFEGGELLQVLKKGCLNIDYGPEAEKTSKTLRKGYLGHCLKITNVINLMVSNQDPEIVYYVEKHQEEWQSFQDQYVTQQNEKENKELGGYFVSKQDESQEGKVGYTKADLANNFKDFLSNGSNSAEPSEGEEDDGEEQHHEEDDQQNDQDVDKKDEDWDMDDNVVVENKVDFKEDTQDQEDVKDVDWKEWKNEGNNNQEQKQQSEFDDFENFGTPVDEQNQDEQNQVEQNQDEQNQDQQDTEDQQDAEEVVVDEEDDTIKKTEIEQLPQQQTDNSEESEQQQKSETQEESQDQQSQQTQNSSPSPLKSEEIDASQDEKQEEKQDDKQEQQEEVTEE